MLRGWEGHSEGSYGVIASPEFTWPFRLLNLDCNVTPDGWLPGDLWVEWHGPSLPRPRSPAMGLAGCSPAFLVPLCRGQDARSPSHPTPPHKAPVKGFCGLWEQGVMGVELACPLPTNEMNSREQHEPSILHL